MTAGIGCPAGRLEAELYKLLICEPGGFFSEHCDTEKTGGMTATLSITLPASGAGGEPVVRHAGEEMTIALNAAEPSELAYAAFRADCAHEVLPVGRGHRPSLVSNLRVRPADTGQRHFSPEAEVPEGNRNPPTRRSPRSSGADARNCADLLACSRDPADRFGRFPLRAELRRHLHGVIDPHKLDMSHVTERKGSPYTLACTKNRANHERRLKEYAGDAKQTAPLAELAPAGSALSDIRTVCGQLREAVAAGERRVPARRGWLEIVGPGCGGGPGAPRSGVAVPTGRAVPACQARRLRDRARPRPPASSP